MIDSVIFEKYNKWLEEVEKAKHYHYHTGRQRQWRVLPFAENPGVDEEEKKAYEINRERLQKECATPHFFSPRKVAGNKAEQTEEAKKRRSINLGTQGENVTSSKYWNVWMNIISETMERKGKYMLKEHRKKGFKLGPGWIREQPQTYEGESLLREREKERLEKNEQSYLEYGMLKKLAKLREDSTLKKYISQFEGRKEKKTEEEEKTRRTSGDLDHPQDGVFYKFRPINLPGKYKEHTWKFENVQPGKYETYLQSLYELDVFLPYIIRFFNLHKYESGLMASLVVAAYHLITGGPAIKYEADIQYGIFQREITHMRGFRLFHSMMKNAKWENKEFKRRRKSEGFCTMAEAFAAVNLAFLTVPPSMLHAICKNARKHFWRSGVWEMYVCIWEPNESACRRFFRDHDNDCDEKQAGTHPTDVNCMVCNVVKTMSSREHETYEVLERMMGEEHNFHHLKQLRGDYETCLDFQLQSELPWRTSHYNRIKNIDMEKYRKQIEPQVEPSQKRLKTNFQFFGSPLNVLDGNGFGDEPDIEKLKELFNSRRENPVRIQINTTESTLKLTIGYRRIKK